MDELVDLDFTISPTFAVKSATLDVMASYRRAEWMDEYAMPWQWEFFRPGRAVPRLVLVRLDERRRGGRL